MGNDRVFRPEAGIRVAMGEKLIIRYDQIGSFLFLEVCSPYAQQDSDMIDDAVVARFK